MIRWFDAVVDENTVYVRDGGTGKNYSYDFTSDSWSKLPDCVHPNGSLAIVGGWLTSIGGNSEPGSYVRNELFSLKEEGSDRRWSKKSSSHPCQPREEGQLHCALELWLEERENVMMCCRQLK